MLINGAKANGAKSPHPAPGASGRPGSSFEDALRCIFPSFCAVWAVALALFQRTLDSHLGGSDLLADLRSRRAPSPRPTKFLLFDGKSPTSASQGVGNIAAGLLAAHMLASETGRVVCVWSRWTDFAVAFRQRAYAEECAALEAGARVYPRLMSWNFADCFDECRIRRMLTSDERVVIFDGNTYPKWSAVARNLFDLHFEPTEALSAVLPWRGGPPPSVVVHLRMQDVAEGINARKGLDDATLHALGVALPSSTFLVTNRVTWYDFFSEEYGWSNAGWDQVVHTVGSPMSKNWGKREGAGAEKTRERQLLEAWSDWYTIIRAKEVYHTVSDFSQSAIHWMGTSSKIVMGTKEDGTLDLVDEAWRRDGEMPRLIDRKLEDLTTRDLQPCFRGKGR